MKFIADAFFARHKPVSTYEARLHEYDQKPVISVQTTLIRSGWVTRSYTSGIVSVDGVSPFPSPAGVAHTPAAPPV
jgi:hypothetical protein